MQNQMHEKLTKKEQQLLERQERLKKQLEQTKNALAQKERQRKQRERDLERSRDTRRKILAGAYLMENKSPEELSELLDGYLVREDDRALFDLPPLPPEPEKESNNT